MRWNLRRTLAIGAALTILGIGLPVATAYSQDDPRNCNDLNDPAFVVCTWLATPEEARDIALFWLSNDGEKLKEAESLPTVTVDCKAPGNVCPDLDGDSEPRGESEGLPGDYQEPGENEGPECEAGTTCSLPGGVAVTPAEVRSAAQTPSGRAVTAAKDAGLRTWVDTELSDDWKAGPQQFTAAVKRVAAVAAQPGVIGIRFTSQLGYNSTAFTTTQEIDKFVSEATTALRAAVPGKKLALHTLVPELGCGTNDACKAEMAKKYPLLSPDQVQSYATSGAIDQLSLDSGLARTEYAAWKITPEQALRNQWIEVRARAWDAYAQIAAEDAGFTGPEHSLFTTAQATDAIADRISQTLMDDGAETVTLWSRWQDAQGKVYRILGDKNANNPTWDQLSQLDAVKLRLATIYNPATPDVDAAADLKKLSEVFSQVYLITA
ncbi:hypothetical protein Misp01_70480 [Microtetraspora sp. NBRC 13810]|uniref:hypothetical protein n=1 Tax=Microtetraspora sp. NBRC 13810 TaxID=3030990 RepID=UPI0024A2870E|nr:hypothetical protein [Microtetraspora sp. NBRC 13810]GLW11920.1 hypothetical protein Misp01_70480 [Microtetraspora sp. NBRC 13810]